MKKKVNEKSEKKFAGWKIKVIIIASVLVVLVALGVSAWFGIRKFAAVKYETKVALVSKQLSYCQELVTAKTRYSDIITLKKSMGFAKSYSIVKYSGILRAGIADFTDISYDVKTDGKTIVLKLPKAELLGNELTSMEVFDEKQSIFVPITTQEIFDEIEAARQSTVEELVDEGLLEEAEEYAKKIITQHMKALGFENVDIR